MLEGIGNMMQLFGEYGWAALILIVTITSLVKYFIKRVGVWNARDKELAKYKHDLLKNELSNHQFFAAIAFKINNEIPTLDFNGKATPVRQKIFRRLLEMNLIALEESVKLIVEEDMDDMTASEWANFIASNLSYVDRRMEELATQAGIPTKLINNYIVWRKRSNELLMNYVTDLAISPVYTTNQARTNTFLYLLNLKLVTVIGDAERTLLDLDSEISGLVFENEIIE